MYKSICCFPKHYNKFRKYGYTIYACFPQVLIKGFIPEVKTSMKHLMNVN